MGTKPHWRGARRRGLPDCRDDHAWRCRTRPGRSGRRRAFRVRGAGQHHADPTFRVVVPTGRLVWPSNFPSGKVGAAYSSRLQSRGGKTPFHWKLASGALAPGLTFNGSSGAVTGKPTKKRTFTCIVQATDAESAPKVADISVSIKIR
jgi:hypothetical protein